MRKQIWGLLAGNISHTKFELLLTHPSKDVKYMAGYMNSNFQGKGYTNGMNLGVISIQMVDMGLNELIRGVGVNMKDHKKEDQGQDPQKD